MIGGEVQLSCQSLQIFADGIVWKIVQFVFHIIPMYHLNILVMILVYISSKVNIDFSEN